MTGVVKIRLSLVIRFALTKPDIYRVVHCLLWDGGVLPSA